MRYGWTKRIVNGTSSLVVQIDAAPFNASNAFFLIKTLQHIHMQ